MQTSVSQDYPEKLAGALYDSDSNRRIESRPYTTEETVAAGADFGEPLFRNPAQDGETQVRAGASTADISTWKFQGVAVRDASMQAKESGYDYEPEEMVMNLTKGGIWVTAGAGGLTKDGSVYAVSNGTFNGAAIGTTTLDVSAHARVVLGATAGNLALVSFDLP